MSMPFALLPLPFVAAAGVAAIGFGPVSGRSEHNGPFGVWIVDGVYRRPLVEYVAAALTPVVAGLAAR